MALHHGWLEQIVPVQTLSDSGVSQIPERYVRPPADRPSFDHPVPGLSVPVIDLGGLVDGSAPDEEAITRTTSAACKEWGFFQVVNHGVSLDLIGRMRKAWKEFFDLPMEAKQVYANSPTTYEGYGSRCEVDKGAILDWGDYFFLQLFPESSRSHDKFPTTPNTLRTTTEEYGREVSKLCRFLMKVLSKSLGLDDGYLQRVFGAEEKEGSMRVSWYPKCPQPELTLGLSPHSDAGGLTVLLPDYHVKGLQVRMGDAWVTVQPLPGALIINVGDQIQIISNEIYKSVEHRVTTNSSAGRLAVAFFCNPKGDAAIGPAQELVTADQRPLYPQIIFKEYRRRVRKMGLHGKSAVESLKGHAAV